MSQRLQPIVDDAGLHDIIFLFYFFHNAHGRPAQISTGSRSAKQEKKDPWHNSPTYQLAGRRQQIVAIDSTDQIPTCNMIASLPLLVCRDSILHSADGCPLGLLVKQALHMIETTKPKEEGHVHRQLMQQLSAQS